jgi:hypothetical protein
MVSLALCSWFPRVPALALELGAWVHRFDLITYYLLPITYYLLPITYYLLPITYYLLPITYYHVPNEISTEK